MTAIVTSAPGEVDPSGPLPEFQELLKVIGFDLKADVISICYAIPPLNEFRAMTMRTEVGIGVAAKHAESRHHCWYGINPLRRPLDKRRGSEKDVARLSALYCDLDFKDSGLGSYETAWAVIRDLERILGRQSAVVHTGNGVQPYWPVDDDGSDLNLSKQTLRRFKGLVDRVAREHGGNVDSLFDLPRIFRVPGSWNVKNPDDPKPVRLMQVPDDIDVPSLAEVSEIMDAYGVAPSAARVLSGEEISAASEWTGAAESCPYVKGMARGWSEDARAGRVTDRHPWLFSQSVRIWSAYRMGCLTDEDLEEAFTFLAFVFQDLLNRGTEKGQPRREGAGEIQGCREDARDWVSQKTDDECWADLGGEPHGHALEYLEWAEVVDLFNPHPPPHERASSAQVAAEPDAKLDSPPAGDDDQQVYDPPSEQASPQDLAELEDAFFGESEILEQIREAARSRMVSPWAVAGCVLMHVAAAHTPTTVLPAMVGGKASLNGAVGLVGPSGVGKSAAESVATDLIGSRLADWVMRIGAGTGEGLIESFISVDEDGNRRIAERPNAFMYVDEIGMLDKVTSRSGTTTFPVLRSMLTGGHVSTTNADARRRRHLPAHSYSIGVVAGIQPALSEVLLSETETAAGTPQRWLWLPATDPLIPDEEPEWPGELIYGLGSHSVGELWVEREVREFVKANHRARARGDGEVLDGHWVLTRLKVAAWLALLHSESGVSRRWWETAGLLMRVSDAERRVCQDALAAAKRVEGAKKAAATYHASRAIASMSDKDEVRVAKTIWRKVNKHSESSEHEEGTCPKRCLTQAVRGPDRKQFGDSPIELAIEREWLVRNEHARFGLGPETPA